MNTFSFYHKMFKSSATIVSKCVCKWERVKSKNDAKYLYQEFSKNVERRLLDLVLKGIYHGRLVRLQDFGPDVFGSIPLQ